MKPHTLLRSVSSPQLQFKFGYTSTTTAHASTFKRLTALATALILLPMFQADLFAQQAPYYPGPQHYSYNNQYDPGQQYQPPYGQPQPAYEGPQSGYGQPQTMSADQLEQLVAPIALNPDQLIALMLAASTYPAQVSDADRWLQAQGNISPDQVAYGANLQAWDPSVKALTAFPQVLAEMDQNIQWTAALGNAYYNQPQDVLEAIQVMRQRAQAAGNLQSTPQEAVSYNQGYIEVAPVNPQVVYVPSYNPWTVYGQPVDPYPGFSLFGAIGSFLSSGFGSSAVQFGLGTVLSAFSHSPFGLLAWGLNWLTQSLLFNHSNYHTASNSVSDWGLRYGGPRAYMAPHRAFVAYNRGYDRGGYGQGFNRSQDRYAGNSFRESYNRGYQSPTYGYNRNQQAWNNQGRNNQAWNRNQQPYNRQNYGSNYGYRSGLYNRSESPFANRTNYNTYNRWYQAYNRNPAPIRSQQYSRSAYGSYGSGFDDRSHAAYSARSSYGAGNAFQSYRSASSGFDRNGFDQRSNSYRGNAYVGNGFAESSGKSSHSGEFHLFGGNHNSSGFGRSENFKAPKFKEPHYKAPKMPKMHSGGGGGHHSSGGGHSHGGGGHHH
jgi:hypothetical protein